MRSLLILCCAVVFPAFAYAQNAAPEPVQMVTDQEKGTVTILIDGKAVVQINRDGLHVVESINYGGVLTDTGSAYVEKIIAGDGHAE